MSDETTGKHPFDGAEDPLAKWLSQFGGAGGGQFDFSLMMAQVEQAMAAMAGRTDQSGIDWTQAKSTARHVVAAAGSDPTPTPAQQRQVAEADRLAGLWLDQSTNFEQLLKQPAAWSRAEWVEHTMESWKTVAEPIVTRLADALAGSFSQQFADQPEQLAQLGQFGQLMGPMMRTWAGSMYAVQLSQAMGTIACEVLTGSEIGVQLLAEPQVVLLPATFEQHTAELPQQSDDVAIYLLIREGARQRLFANVGWLAPQMLALLEHYAREISIDIGAITETVDLDDPSSLTPERLAEMSHALQGKLFSPSQTPEQREVLGRLETLLALVEGWVDEVAANTTRTWMPHVAEQLAEATRRRRATQNPSQQLFASLVGLEMRPRRVRDAANLWAALTRDRGVAGRDALWAHPDLMPTEADLDDPLRLIERSDTEPEADEMDLALAQLLEEAEQERRGEPGGEPDSPA